MNLNEIGNEFFYIIKKYNFLWGEKIKLFRKLMEPLNSEILNSIGVDIFTSLGNAEIVSRLDR